MTTIPPPGWDDAAVRSPGGHVLQSSTWARIRESQGWRPEFVRFSDGPLPCALILWKGEGVTGFGYVPRGPIVEDRSQLARTFQEIGELANKRKVIFIKVDPEIEPEVAQQPLRRAGFHRGPDVQPILATLELDLQPDEDVLFKGLEKDTRWSVRQAEKKAVKVRAASSDDDLRAFFDLYSATGRRARFITRPWDYYRRMWSEVTSAGLGTIRLAELDGQAVAGALCWRCGEREVYQTAATNDAGRAAHAAYALLWHCIIEARRTAARRFDFGGIPADVTRKDDPMYGPYLFKRGFGGTERRFVGAYDAVPRMVFYRSYRTLQPAYLAALRLLDRFRS